jgi:WD40 repeat protein
MKHGDWVSSVAFSPDGKTIMAATHWWIHQSIVFGETTKPKASRLLPGRWTGAYRFLDDKGDQMQVAVRITGDSIKIINLRFDKPDAPPIQGDPAVLLKEWQEKLALKLDEKTGKIEHRYQ